MFAGFDLLNKILSSLMAQRQRIGETGCLYIQDLPKDVLYHDRNLGLT